jgi:hypothetical protein
MINILDINEDIISLAKKRFKSKKSKKKKQEPKRIKVLNKDNYTIDEFVSDADAYSHYNY